MDRRPTFIVLLVLCGSFAVGHSLSVDVLKTLGNVLNPDALLRSLSSQRPSQAAGASDCDIDIQRFLDALSQKELWALRVFDSSSYFVTGILHGNSGGLGNYDECLRARPPGEADKYWPLFSLVEILVEQQKNVSTGTRSVGKTRYHDVFSTFNSSSVAGGLNFDDEKDLGDCDNEGTCERKDVEWNVMLEFNLGICWPRSCGAETPAKAVRGLLSYASSGLEGTGMRVRVLPPRRGASDVGLPGAVSRADWAAMAVCIILVVFAAIGTFLDVMQTRAAGRRAGWHAPFLAFSVYTNGRRLINVSAPTSDSLTAINGIKVFSIFWVLLGHRYRFIIDLPYTNKITVLEIVKDWHKEFIIATPLSVDTFFAIGGILNAYNFFLGVRKGRPVGFIKFFVHRYIRLTPALALMVGITATWMYHLNDGPLWNKLVWEAREKCQNNWWTSLLYVSNYVNPDTQCMMQAWYLMTDMQLHWMSALILFPMARWRKAGVIWLILLIPVSCAIPFYVAYVMHYRAPVPTVTSSRDGFEEMKYLYYPAHTRATSYFIGLLIGYELYRARYVMSGFRLGWKTVTAGWTLSTVLALTVIFSGYPLYQLENEVNIWYSATYIGFHRLAWSISICWIVFACGTGYGGPVNTFLSCSPFVVLGRLVYGTYLTHAAVQLADAAAIRSPEYYSDYRMVQSALSDFVLSSFLGLILSLMVESPVGGLEKLIFGGPPKRKRKNSAQVQPDVSPQSVSANVSPQYNPPNVSSQFIPPNVSPQYIPPNVPPHPDTNTGIDNPALDVVVSEDPAKGGPSKYTTEL